MARRRHSNFRTRVPRNLGSRECQISDLEKIAHIENGSQIPVPVELGKRHQKIRNLASFFFRVLIFRLFEVGFFFEELCHLQDKFCPLYGSKTVLVDKTGSRALYSVEIRYQTVLGLNKAGHQSNGTLKGISLALQNFRLMGKQLSFEQILSFEYLLSLFSLVRNIVCNYLKLFGSKNSDVLYHILDHQVY